MPTTKPLFNLDLCKYILTLVSRRKNIIFYCIGAAMILLTLFIMIKPKYHTSKTSLYIKEIVPKIIKDSDGATKQSKNYLSTQAILLNSTPILADAVERSIAKHNLTIFGESDPVAFIRNHLKISIARNSDILTINLNSNNPKEGAILLNALNEAFIQYHKANNQGTATEMLEVLESQKNERNKELEKAVAQVLAFNKNNMIFSFQNEQDNIIFQKLKTISNALTVNKLTLIDHTSNYRAAQEIIDSPELLDIKIGELMTEGVFMKQNSNEAVLQSQIQKLETEKLLLSKNFTASSPIIINLNNTINGIKAQLHDIKIQYVVATRDHASQQIKLTKINRDKIQEEYDAQIEVAQDFNAKDATLTQLEKQIVRTENAIKNLDERIKELDIKNDAGIYNISILEKPKEDKEVENLYYELYYASALFLGLLASGGLIYLTDLTDDRLRNAAETARIFNAPVLNTITALSDVSEDKRYYHAMYPDINSWSQTFQQLRIELNSAIEQNDYTTIMVTSPQSKSGATTVACNLAITQAQAGLRTLIIDMNMHNPSIENIFNVNGKNGLWQLLREKQSLNNCITKINIENLYVMPAGGMFPTTITDALDTEHFHKIFSELSNIFDRIIIDTVSIDSANDAKYLLPYCDATLGVISMNNTTRKTCANMLNKLKSVNGRLTGIVMNQSQIPSKNDSYEINGSKTYFFNGEKKSTPTTSRVKHKQQVAPMHMNLTEMHETKTTDTPETAHVPEEVHATIAAQTPEASHAQKQSKKEQNTNAVNPGKNNKVNRSINQIEQLLKEQQSDLFIEDEETDLV